MTFLQDNLVSIPYRYALNGWSLEMMRYQIHVSIPYRYALNLLLEGKKVLLLEFQFLIGML